MKKFIISILAAALMIMAVPVSISAYSASNWMGSLADGRSLASISIPGTHDSGARFEPISGTAKCQDLTIAQQLSAGVRFLDIRGRHIDNAFTIHHGVVYQNMNFQDVLNQCYDFLNSNPSETIIMSLKEEHTPSNNTRTYEQTFDSYVAGNPGKWYLQDSVPNLGQVRGKIVLVRRFAAGTTKGINATNWADNTTFTIGYGSTNIKIQDQYNVPDTSAKWNLFQSVLNEAKAQNSGWLYINYASGVKSFLGIPSITTVSNYMNPRIESYFSSNTSGRFGIVVMDFANAARCSLIINTNF